MNQCLGSGWGGFQAGMLTHHMHMLAKTSVYTCFRAVITAHMFYDSPYSFMDRLVAIETAHSSCWTSLCEGKSLIIV